MIKRRQTATLDLVLRRLIWSAIVILFMLTAHESAAFSGNRVKIYFFYGEGCPHCVHEKIFLGELKKKYPQVEIKPFEVWNDRPNAVMFAGMAEAHGIKASAVPVTFIGGFRPIIGYSGDDITGKEIEDRVRFCLDNGCPDPVDKAQPPSIKTGIPESEEFVSIPGIGDVDVSKMALPLLTLILGGLDGFNPCAFFVLFTLLGILTHARTRGRMILIGGVFVFFSGFIYFIFMAAWLNFFLYMGEFRIITSVAGGVALIIALINIKDFFFFRRGVSLSIPEKAKPGLFMRMRELLKTTSLVSMVLGTAVLAAVANIYELLCTAGFPMVFTRVLTLHALPVAYYYLYLALYNVVYVIPLAIIVVIFTVTLGARKLTEFQGQVLKLISGMMMLCLGLVLIINPSMFSNILAGAALLIISLSISGAIIILRKFVERQ